MNNKKDNGIAFKTSRIEALSDGVFAIVMTLLVIELVVPIVPKLRASEELGGMLLEMWPKFFAFAVSFLILGILWFIHHARFHFIKHSSSVFTWINIFFLLMVALVPFSTALIGEYHIYSKTAVIFYGVNGFLCMLMLNIIWWYASKNKRLIDKDTEPNTIKRIQISGLIPTAIFIPVIALSFVSTLASVIILVFNALFGIIGTMIWGGRGLGLGLNKA
jgi:uncharacterized membrane protein